MTARGLSISGALATTGVLAVVALVPLLPGRLDIGQLPLDAVTITVPIALLMSAPLLTRLGAAGIPRLGIEAAALAFLGWAVVSSLFAGPSAAVLSTWGRYASYVVLAMVVGAVSAAPARRRVVLWAFVLSSSTAIGIGFRQYLSPTQGIGMEGLDAVVATRIFSTFENPNFFAEFLVLAFAATLMLVIAERGWTRSVCTVALSAQAIALLLTYTRGSWLALAVGLAVGLTMVNVRLVIPFLVGGAALLPIVPGAVARVVSMFSLEGTASFRLILWRISGLAIQERPLFGAGIGRYYEAFRDVMLTHPEIGMGFLVYGAHNSYFQLTAETGIIGGILFAWMVFEAGRMGLFYNSRITDTRVRLQNAALTAGLVALALNALTSNSFQHPRAAVFFFVLIGLQAGLGAQWWHAPVSEPRGVRHRLQVLDGSVLVRSYRYLLISTLQAWNASLLKRVLTRRPLPGGSYLPRSAIARVVLGPGSGGDRTPEFDRER